MRTSNLLLSTLKEIPSDAEIVSHQLMLRAGLIRKLASGLYTWLPLGLRILRKVEAIVRDEMNALCAQEILMPVIQPSELWEETGRWEQFGPQLLKVTDRQNRQFCFGPTHEEVVTDLSRRELKSYKQLPITLYQIQLKFRDEIRPRFGVMRAREFLMKDAYSFHINEDCLQKTYEQMFQAYTNIFTRLGLTFRAVLADTGNIGGKLSHEFHVLADSGEDLLVYSNQSTYAANREFAEALPPTVAPRSNAETLTTVTTPGIKSVEEQAIHLKVKPKDILQTLIVKGRDPKTPFIALLLRGDHELNPIKAEKCEQVLSPLTFATVEELKTLAKCEPGFVGPQNLNIPLIADYSAAQMTNFICGANKTNEHYACFNWDRDAKLTETRDLRFVQTGDPSPDHEGTLHFTRGIEVGHIFQLGTKYAEQMKATVLNESGRAQALTMGCYGIGISRIVAAAIEQNYDEKGITWPEAMAPFQVVLIPMGFYKSTTVQESTESLYQELCTAGFEVLLDDRSERPGIMFADAELIGIPHRIVIGEKNLLEKSVEYKARKSDSTQKIPLTELITFLRDQSNLLQL